MIGRKQKATKAKAEAPDLRKLFDQVQGRTRQLWEHLSGRARREFPLGARGCGDGTHWLLSVDGNFSFTRAIEVNGELYEVGTVRSANKEVVAQVPFMTTFQSHAELAKAEREKRLAEIGPEAAEIELRRGWNQECHKVGHGMPVRHELRRSAAPPVKIF